MVLLFNAPPTLALLAVLAAKDTAMATETQLMTMTRVPTAAIAVDQLEDMYLHLEGHAQEMDMDQAVMEQAVMEEVEATVVVAVVVLDVAAVVKVAAAQDAASHKVLAVEYATAPAEQNEELDC